LDALICYTRTEIDVKHSRFIAEAFPVKNQLDARDTLKQQKIRFADASHVVHAFIAGGNSEIRGMSDDGEPPGTAARPIMDILAGKNCTNILLTVTRYFGGTLLGTGGLVKAYGDAAKSVLSECRFTQLVEKCRFEFSIPYTAYEKAGRFLPSIAAEITGTVFEAAVIITGSIPEINCECLREFVTDITGGKCSVTFSPA
jgi:uncharacterized YigZ family protein